MQARVSAALRIETWRNSHPPATSRMFSHSRKCSATGWRFSPSVSLGRQRSISSSSSISSIPPSLGLGCPRSISSISPSLGLGRQRPTASSSLTSFLLETAAVWDGRQSGDLGLLSMSRPVWESPFWWSMNFAAVLLAAVAALYISRPRGWADNFLVEVRESQVQGLGVFARRDIPAGTLLGVYPGRPRPPHEMAAKARQAPGARDYAFRTPSGAGLDPTDAEGRVSAAPRPGLPWFDVDPALTRVNEPPPGQSVNVEVVTNGDPLEIRFVTLRDVARGEELFIDYGTSYDRSGYG